MFFARGHLCDWDKNVPHGTGIDIRPHATENFDVKYHFAVHPQCIALFLFLLAHHGREVAS